MKLIIQTKQNLDNTALLQKLNALLGDDFEFVFISPKDKSYKIEEIRNFINKLNNKQTSFTKNLFYILINGDTLSPVCQNALLKTLEESSYSIGIIVKNTDSLLPTIKSRCQVKNLENYEYLENNKIKDFELELTNLFSIAKPDRKEVIEKIENLIDSLDGKNISLAISLQEAVNKLNANCKVDAVLVELEFMMKLKP